MIQTQWRVELRVSDFVWANIPERGRSSGTVIEAGLATDIPDERLYKILLDVGTEKWVMRQNIVFMRRTEKFNRGQAVYHYLHGEASVLGVSSHGATQEEDLFRIKTAAGVLLEVLCTDLHGPARSETIEVWRLNRMRPEDVVHGTTVYVPEPPPPDNLLCHEDGVIVESPWAPGPVLIGDEVVVMSEGRPGLVGRLDRFYSQGDMCVVKDSDGEIHVQRSRLRKLDMWGLRSDGEKINEPDLPYHGHKP